MATDYDAPRRGDVDETELAESLELPGADLSNLSGEELTVRVLPKQDDEFTCSVCFLVHHRSRLARERNPVDHFVDHTPPDGIARCRRGKDRLGRDRSAPGGPACAGVFSGGRRFCHQCHRALGDRRT